MPKRTDLNQKEIVEAFRQLGASVQILSDVGKGCPDIIIGLHGLNYLIEIKNGKKPASGQKLTEPEQKFFENWRGQVKIINSIDAAIEFIQSVWYHNNL